MLAEIDSMLYDYYYAKRNFMTHDSKYNDQLKVIYKSDGAGAKELRLLAKGRVIFLIVFFSIAGYLWANKPESIKIPEEYSLSRLEFSHLIYNKRVTF